jgi:subtilisin family serine protease
MNISRLATLIGAVALCAVASAGGAKRPFFVEKPGSMEFTGQMIVRPIQLGDAIRMSGTLNKALAMRQRAQKRIQPDVIEYIADTDEYVTRLPLGMNENQYAEYLMSSGEYQYAEPNWRVYPAINPNDPQYPSQWHLPKIGCPQAWDILVGNPNQIIAYTDTGIRIGHQDLEPNRVPGYNSVDGLTEQQGGQINDINGHGTHVAGIGSAIGNNAKNVCGVGWNFKIMMVRVTNSSGGSSTLTWLTNGARWAADNGAKSISTSYSGVSSSSVETTGQYIRGKGACYLWAAGNDGAAMNSFDHPSVIIVGATDSNDNRASFSNYGVALDVFAPGVNILSTYNSSNTSTATLSGTSMAAPCANGVVAMIFAKNPNWTPSQVETQLFSTCKDMGSTGNDNTYGWGRVDCFKAVQGGSSVVDPSAFTVKIGQHIGGTLQSLFNSENDKLLIGAVPAISPTTPSAQVEVTGTSPTKTPTQIDIKIEQSATTVPVNLRIEAYNYTSGTWVLLSEVAGSTTDQVLNFTISSNASQFVNQTTNAMLVRLSAIDKGAIAANWAAAYDEVQWTVQ